jgi:hypothetical protein
MGIKRKVEKKVDKKMKSIEYIRRETGLDWNHAPEHRHSNN